MSIINLARKEIRELRTYQTTRASAASTRMNANEAAAGLGIGLAQDLNRYPELRPTTLTCRLADYYNVERDNVLVTRGSSEGIDLLMRTFCAASQDNIISTPPVFDMYHVYANIQGVKIMSVNLQADNNFALPVDDLLQSCDARTKLIFLSSPNNPVGAAIPQAEILKIINERKDKSVVIVDEAYIEYSDEESMAAMVSQYDNLVVLRTLSKALALAGARCGAVIASPQITSLLGGVLAPYAMATPVVASAEAALSDERLVQAKQLIRETVNERDRLRTALADCDAVNKVWPSHANFLLARFRSLGALEPKLDEAGIAIRTFSDDSLLRNCARITVGLKSDNNRLVESIRSLD